MASIGVYFIGFASDNRLVTVSDAIRVWDLSTGRELRHVPAWTRLRFQVSMALTVESRFPLTALKS